MIAKLIKGKGFRGVLEYGLRPEKGYVLDTNMAGSTPRELAAEFGRIRSLRASLGRAVCHVSIAIAPGEKLNDNQWREVAAAYLDHMGFGSNQYVAIRHTDTEHEHMHLVISRISPSGEVTSDKNDYRRQEELMRRLERQLNLQITHSSRDAPGKAPKRGELERMVHTGQPSVRLRLQTLVGKAVTVKKSLSGFINILGEQGVEVRLNQAKTGIISGISFSIDGVCMKDSDLGKAFTWKALQKQGLHHEQNRAGPGIGISGENSFRQQHQQLGYRDSQNKTGRHTPAVGNLGGEERRSDEKSQSLGNEREERIGVSQNVNQRGQGASR